MDFSIENNVPLPKLFILFFVVILVTVCFFNLISNILKFFLINYTANSIVSKIFTYFFIGIIAIFLIYTLESQDSII